MLVKDLMSTYLHTVTPEDSVLTAIHLMRRENIGILPVCDSQRHILGLLTDRDILLKYSPDYQQKIQDIMTKDVITINSKEDIHQAASKLSSNQIHRLPVVENDRLVGILSLKDIAKKKMFIAEIGHIIYEISRS